MKYICTKNFKINNILVGNKGDVLEITCATPSYNESLKDVEGYVDIKNLNTNQTFGATWIDVDDDTLKPIR